MYNITVKRYSIIEKKITTTSIGAKIAVFTIRDEKTGKTIQHTTTQYIETPVDQLSFDGTEIYIHEHKNNPAKKITTFDEATILAMRDAGLSTYQIADNAGISQMHVRRVLAKKPQIIEKLKQQNISYEEIKQNLIAKYYDFAEKSIEHAINNHTKISPAQSVIVSKVAIDAIRLLTEGNKTNNTINIAINNAFINATKFAQQQEQQQIIETTTEEE